MNRIFCASAFLFSFLVFLQNVFVLPIFFVFQFLEYKKGHRGNTKKVGTITNIPFVGGQSQKKLYEIPQRRSKVVKRNVFVAVAALGGGNAHPWNGWPRSG